ncbi:unnamed protein product, partial [Dibothriocephalus latus]
MSTCWEAEESVPLGEEPPPTATGGVEGEEEAEAATAAEVGE